MALYTWFLVGLLTAVSIVGIPGNILVMCVYVSKTKRTGTRIFIIVLAGVDLFICALTGYRYYLWIFEDTFSSDFVCRLFSWVGLASELSSAFVTTAVAVDRYLAICRPHLGWMTHRRAELVSAVGIAASTALTLPALGVYMVYAEPGAGPGIQSCVITGLGEDRIWVFSALSTLAISFAGMMATALVMYMLVYREVRKRMKIRPSDALKSSVLMEKPERPAMASLLALGDSFVGISFDNRRHSIGEPEGIARKKLRPRPDVRERRTGSPYPLKPRSSLPRSLEALDVADERPTGRQDEILTTIGISSGDSMASDGSRARLTATLVGRDSSASGRPLKTVRKNKTGKMLLLATVVFVLTWSARLVVWMISFAIADQWADLKKHRHVAFAFLTLLQHLYYTTPAVNPVIYSFVNDRFRQESLRYIRKAARAGVTKP